MRSEFMTERNGKQYALYAGLLDESHQQGLKGINTMLLQIPDDTNGHVAICRAEVETEKGVFTGIGDASPQNVARPMVTCLIRMAETRAKARALRDAVNVGTVSVEELDGEEAPARPAAPKSSAAPAPARQVPPNAGKPAAKPAAGAPPAGETIPQVLDRETREVRALLVKWKWDPKDIQSEFARMVPGPSAAQKLDQLREWRAQLETPNADPFGGAK